jgi:hypothetical protein
MDVVRPFIECVTAVVTGIIVLKVFFTLWRVVEKRLHPERITSPTTTPEVSFGGLRKKPVNVYMKNGDILRNYRYLKTLLSGDGDYSTCTNLYFEFKSPEGNGVFISGMDISRIETA